MTIQERLATAAEIIDMTAPLWMIPFVIWYFVSVVPSLFTGCI